MRDYEKPLPESYTLEGHLMTELILEVFRLNGQLIITGDRLVKDLGLTSARWQVLNEIKNSNLITVAQMARNMGLQRQSIQRLVNELEKQKLVKFQINPNHKRSKYVSLTEKGLNLVKNKVKPLQSNWANNLGEKKSSQKLKSAISTLKKVREHLENTGEEFVS